MEKILLQLDTTNHDYNSFEFACYLAKITHSKITAIFLENMLEPENILQVRLRRETNSGNDVLIEEASEKRILIEKNIKIIKDRCEHKKSISIYTETVEYHLLKLLKKQDLQMYG